MAHESFEDPATARMMNAGFVNVKVDREERPDVDAVYMEATQAMTGQGGWPMTVFLTPDGAPFYCGTYFPREHFQRLLQGVARAWDEERGGVLEQGRRVVEALSGPRTLGRGRAPGADALDAAVEALAADFDPAHGGFGGAPKFPPSMLLSFLLANHARTGRDRPLAMAARTAEAMARGGIYDQLGGGFARYSVDARWVVPHFEKMLYDNALLLRAYTRLWRTTGDPLARRVALETAEWMIADLGTDEGGFASALDADSEGEEGRYYVWTPAELREALGEDDAAWAAALFGVTDEGTFEHGFSVLRLPADPDDPDRYTRVRAALLAARARRVRPARDDKVVAAWNGLAVAGLAEAGALLDRPDLVARAEAAADLVARVHLRDGRLVRTSRDGSPGTSAGVLEDYADLAEGLLALHAVTGDPARLELAGRLLDTVLDRFADDEGGFYDTADDSEALFNRPQDPTDGATPSGRFAAAGALLTYAGLTGSERHRGRRRGPGPGRPAGAQGAARRRVGHGRGRDPAQRAAGDRRGRPRRRPRDRRTAPHRADGGPAGHRRHPGRRRPGPGRAAAGGPPAGRRAASRLRLPGLRLPAAGHHGGRPARADRRGTRLSRALPRGRGPAGRREGAERVLTGR